MRYDNKDKRLRGRNGVARRLRMWSANPFCAMCGKLTEYDAFNLDHKTPLALGGEDTDDNLQVLCTYPCHAKKTALEEAGNIHGTFTPEWVNPIPALTIVFGPPGSGKSTYVRDNADPRDMVIDMDVIRSELSGLPIYQAGPEYLRRSAAVRNNMLSALARSGQPGWLIATGKGEADRTWWVDRLKPRDVVILRTPIDECIRRIKADARRPESVKKSQIEAVRAWWMAETSPHTAQASRATFNANGQPVW